MNTVELKKELHDIINESDDNFIKVIYEMTTAYREQKKIDQILAEHTFVSVEEAKRLTLDKLREKCKQHEFNSARK